MQEIQHVFKITLLDTLATPVGTPLSGSALYITCIRTFLGILNPAIDQPVNH
jgi:hypothetical protein